LSHISIPSYSGYFGDGGLMNYFPRLILSHDPPSLNLPSSKAYRYEPLALDKIDFSSNLHFFFFSFFGFHLHFFSLIS
jgi:hypothetical protein